MTDLPTDRTLDSTPSQHLSDHNELHRQHNWVKGPFTLAHDTPNIDTGVTLWTPAVGDIITGLWVEIGEAFDVDGELIGLGISGTVDADLAFKFPVDSAPPVHATFARGEGVGFGFGASMIRLLSAAPIRARTVTGGNVTGSLQLWVATRPI